LVGETNDADAKAILGEIEKLNADKKFINVAGFVEHDNILKYYLKSDYYIFPSLCETFGLPKFEAEQIALPKFV
jgi:glycosyltransferase involved in cell wall biosynthesis